MAHTKHGHRGIILVRYPPTPAGTAPVKSRRVGFCLSSRQEEVTGFKSWRHRHPTTHTVFSASPTLPRSPFQTLSVSTAVSALPTHSTSSPPSLTAPTAPLPLSSLGRLASVLEVFKGFQCVPKLLCPNRPHRSHRPHATPPPVPKPPPPYRHRPHRPHRPHATPPPTHLPGRPCKCFTKYLGFQCVPKPHRPRPHRPHAALASVLEVYLKASNVCPNEFRR